MSDHGALEAYHGQFREANEQLQGSQAGQGGRGHTPGVGARLRLRGPKMTGSPQHEARKMGEVHTARWESQRQSGQCTRQVRHTQVDSTIRPS
jgi:hypothetical protein